MPKAFIIEVRNRTAGIVTPAGRKFRFFSSAPAFDRLEGREFRSARDAERAARRPALRFERRIRVGDLISTHQIEED